MTFDAFDNAVEWLGVVSEIDSAETIKGGAVYYRATVSFNEKDARIRSGMTANIWIKTAISENTLTVPASALQKDNNKNIVKILQGNQAIEKEVTIGLKNDLGMVEIVSGLSPNDQVIIGDKK
jgi:macrolide-specific efflux system membrane fusion protein